MSTHQEGFNPDREIYHLSDSGDLAALVDDLRSIVGSVWDAYDNPENGAILRQAFGNEASLTQAKDIFNRYRLTNRIISTSDREAAVETEEVEIPQTVAQEHEEFFARKGASEIRA